MNAFVNIVYPIYSIRYTNKVIMHAIYGVLHGGIVALQP